MATKEILIIILVSVMVIILIVMNIQNNLYTIQFFSPPNDSSTASPQAKIMDPQVFGNFLCFAAFAYLFLL